MAIDDVVVPSGPCSQGSVVAGLGDLDRQVLQVCRSAGCLLVSLLAKSKPASLAFYARFPILNEPRLPPMPLESGCERSLWEAKESELGFSCPGVGSGSECHTPVHSYRRSGQPEHIVRIDHYSQFFVSDLFPDGTVSARGVQRAPMRSVSLGSVRTSSHGRGRKGLWTFFVVPVAYTTGRS
jgi:hypothetical protein